MPPDDRRRFSTLLQLFFLNPTSNIKAVSKTEYRHRLPKHQCGFSKLRYNYHVLPWIANIRPKHQDVLYFCFPSPFLRNAENVIAFYTKPPGSCSTWLVRCVSCPQFRSIYHPWLPSNPVQQTVCAECLSYQHQDNITALSLKLVNISNVISIYLS